MATTKIYVIHENDAWVEPLRSAFAEIDARGRVRASESVSAEEPSRPRPVKFIMRAAMRRRLWE